MAVAVGEHTFIIYKATIAIGLFDLPLESVTFKRTPSAPAHDIVGCQCPRLAAYHDEVGFHAFANEAAVLDAEKAGRVVAHQFHHPLQAEYALFHQIEHGNK